MPLCQFLKRPLYSCNLHCLLSVLLVAKLPCLGCCLLVLLDLSLLRCEHSISTPITLGLSEPGFILDQNQREWPHLYRDQTYTQADTGLLSCFFLLLPWAEVSPGLLSRILFSHANHAHSGIGNQLFYSSYINANVFITKMGSHYISYSVTCHFYLKLYHQCSFSIINTDLSSFLIAVYISIYIWNLI